MTIEGLGSATLYRPAAAVEQQEALSKTDWKTHSVVVLSYLLIGIGFGLACSAVYFVATVGPLIAMASPVIPIALGILGLQYTAGPDSKLSPVHSARNQPIGIVNNGGNCWINASLQLLFNVPAYRKMMENLSAKSNSLVQRVMSNSGLLPLISAFETYKKEEQGTISASSKQSVDSQTIRQWLHTQDPSISLDIDVQDDPLHMLSPVLKKAGHRLPTEISKEITRQGTDVSINSQRTSPYYFDLAFDLDGGENNLTDALNHHFNYTEQLPTAGIRQTIRFLEKTPDEFSVVLESAAETSAKVVRKVEGAMEVSLTATQVGKDAHYVPDGFITHEGDTRNWGHYVAYLYKDGSWWEASDFSVRKISLKEAAEKLSTARFIHYQRASSAVQS